MALIPIWRNTVYSFSSSGMSYYIKESGNKIFSGKAVNFPNSNSGSININKICENYLQMNFPEITGNSGTYTHANAAKSFSLYNSSDSLLDTYDFYYNWSYLSDTNPLSKPINKKYCEGMYKLRTTIYNNQIVTEYNNTSSTGQGYTIASCGEYALYYLNRFGGWDCFLIEGKVKQKDEYSVQTYETSFDWNNVNTREINRFRNEITHLWELNTDWLTDAQSELLALHLFSSNMVYLHDLGKNKIIPVEITDTGVEYKKFKNDRKLVSYTINVRESNKKIIL